MSFSESYYLFPPANAVTAWSTSIPIIMALSSALSHSHRTAFPLNCAVNMLPRPRSSRKVETSAEPLNAVLRAPITDRLPCSPLVCTMYDCCCFPAGISFGFVLCAPIFTRQPHAPHIPGTVRRSTLHARTRNTPARGIVTYVD